MTITATPPRAVELSPAQKRDEEVRQRFERDTAKHELTVLRDDGLYRHLRFQTPGTSVYFYDLITWPGHLVICGDAGDYHFARIADMFEFFESDRGGINPHYWSEKLQSGAGPGADIARRYSYDVLKARLDEWVTDLVDWGDISNADADALRQAVREQILDRGDAHHEYSARELLQQFEHNGRRIESWEWDLRDYDTRFLWCCWAIVRGIARYREHGGWAPTSYSGTYAAVHAALWDASSDVHVRPECLRMLLAVGELGGTVEGASHDLVGALGSNSTCIRRSALDLHDAGLVENTSKRGVGMRVALTERGRELVASMTAAIETALRSSPADGGAS